MSLENMIYLVGLVLTVGALGGLALVGLGELRVRSLRRSRLAGVGGTGTDRASGLVEKSGGGFGDQVLGAVRRLGQQSAVRDPAKVSLLRSRLMQAGFYSREAPVIFLGVKATALAVATVGVVLTLPMLIGQKGGNMGALALAVGL